MAVPVWAAWSERNGQGCDEEVRDDDQGAARGRKEEQRRLARQAHRCAELGDWRGETLARVRALIKETDPDVVETWKWRGVPVWEHDGILCTGESYKTAVKLTFAKGAVLPDPSRLFNASLDGNVRRAIDIREGDRLNERALKALIRAAVAANTAKKARRPQG